MVILRVLDYSAGKYSAKRRCDILYGIHLRKALFPLEHEYASQATIKYCANKRWY
jgi:hypothetical protein